MAPHFRKIYKVLFGTKTDVIQFNNYVFANKIHPFLIR